jgi:asparagine N-glycosylation enzyme membrane subunit Stt3
MRLIIQPLLGLVLGYAMGAASGLALSAVFSGNHHDRLQEMVMTAAFFTGPIGAVLGIVFVFARTAVRR